MPPMPIGARSLLAFLAAAPFAIASAPSFAQTEPPPSYGVAPAPSAVAPAPYGVAPAPYGVAPPAPYAVAPAPVAQPAPDTSARSTSLWYGWQTLAAIAPFDIAMFVGLAKWDESYGHATFATGFVGRNLVPAAVHMFHRRPGVGFGSIGLHAGATATGVAIAYAIGIGIQEGCKPLDPCRNGFRGVPPGVGYGAVAGSMVGTVLDVVFFAHRSRATFGVTGSAPMQPMVAFSPYATKESAGFAAGGTF